jgi:hypothetical protein
MQKLTRLKFSKGPPSGGEVTKYRLYNACATKMTYLGVVKLSGRFYSIWKYSATCLLRAGRYGTRKRHGGRTVCCLFMQNSLFCARTW